MASKASDRFPSSATKQQYYRNRKKILQRESICAICGTPVDKDAPKYHPLSAEIDHIIPIAKGGNPSDMGNLQLVHRKCNRLKSDKMPEIKAQEFSDVNPESWLTW